MGKTKGVGKFVAGAAIGAGLGLLFAPKKGKELRKNLKNKLILKHHFDAFFVHNIICKKNFHCQVYILYHKDIFRLEIFLCY